LSLVIALAIHESAHLLTAVILNIKLRKIRITLFGFNLNAKIHDIGFIKKILLMLSGPVSNILFHFIFKNTVYYNFAYINIFLACINLVPIVPLDGGNICKAIMEEFLDSDSVCRYIIMTNSFFITCFIIIIYIYKEYIFFILVLMAFKGIIEEHSRLIEKNIKHNYNKYRFNEKSFNKSRNAE
jgi:Zn-dependent protease